MDYTLSEYTVIMDAGHRRFRAGVIAFTPDDAIGVIFARSRTSLTTGLILPIKGMPVIHEIAVVDGLFDLPVAAWLSPWRTFWRAFGDALHERFARRAFPKLPCDDIRLLPAKGGRA